MILFLKDINNNVIFDHKTNNKSFLKMHLILKKMGIKNNKFFLALTQPELSGIDPHNLPNNSEELKMKIAYECYVNPWYYFREVVRVPTTGKSNGEMFKLNRANLSIIWLYFLNIDSFLVIPRQIGKTMSSLIIHSYFLFIGGFNLELALLTKDDKLRIESISWLKQIRDMLPSYLIFVSKKDTDNTKELTYKYFNNKYSAFIAQNSLMGAESLGRGMKIATQLWDEIAYFKYLHITYPAAISSTNAAVEDAKRNNQPYSNILITTAGKLDTKEGRFAYNLLLNSLGFTELFYDIEDKNKLIDILNKNSKQRMMYCEYNFLQLGKTIEWFKEKSSRSGGSADTIKRDYLGIWTYGSSESAVSDALLNIIRKSRKDPTFIQDYDSIIIKWYLPIDKIKSSDFSKTPMIIGADPSESIGEDFFSFVFINPIDLGVIGSCRCNTTNLVKIGLFIVDILTTFKKSLLIMERNSTGSAILDVLFMELPKYGINPFTRIYNEIIQNKELDKYKDVNIYDPYVYGTTRKEFGFRLTGGNSNRGRSFIYKTVFFEILNYNADKIHDQDLINEICDLKKKDGRIDHGSNKHDDLVIAFIYACYILLYGKNLKYYSFYKGIENEVMSKAEKNIDTKEDHSKNLLDLNKIKEKIKKLNNSINKEKIQTNKIRKMHQLVELKSYLNAFDNNDTIMANTKKAKSFSELNKKKKEKNNISDKKHIKINNYFNFMN